MRRLLHMLAFSASIFLPLLVAIGVAAIGPISYSQHEALSLAKLFWFTGALFVVTNAIGLLYGSPWEKEKRHERDWAGLNPKKRLTVAYVSRGDNEVALRRAITASRLILEDMGVNYKIEAITDMDVEVGADINVRVPDNYQTEKGAKFKARALHYAINFRHQLDRFTRDDWILHLDEESLVTPEVVRGIAAYIEPDNAIYSIGQGEIKYNAYNYGNNLLITAIDAIRTGDDLGRFRLQYKLFKKPLFGMHGSFFLVPALLERHIGFDLGGKGSITEDAYFALVAADKGVRFGWVDGFIREQSPFSLLALLKQRRRWITGLRLLMWDKAISRRQRLILGTNMLLWRLAWVGPVVTAWNIVAGGSVLPPAAEVSAALVTGMVGVVYMVGAYRNVIGANLKPHKQLLIWVASGLLFPIACLVEGVAVIYSIIKPNQVSFDVVDKN